MIAKEHQHSSPRWVSCERPAKEWVVYWYPLLVWVLDSLGISLVRTRSRLSARVRTSELKVQPITRTACIDSRPPSGRRTDRVHSRLRHVDSCCRGGARKVRGSHRMLFAFDRDEMREMRQQADEHWAWRRRTAAAASAGLIMLACLLLAVAHPQHSRVSTAEQSTGVAHMSI
jgi:hypothetical protein